MTYQLQLDFDQPVQEFTDLKQVFEVLKSNEHIFIYDSSHEVYQKKAEDECVDLTDRPLYIEVSTSTEGVFVSTVEAWIEDYMIDEFYNPEQRPHIEAYLPK